MVGGLGWQISMGLGSVGSRVMTLPSVRWPLCEREGSHVVSNCACSQRKWDWKGLFVVCAYQTVLTMGTQVK